MNAPFKPITMPQTLPFNANITNVGNIESSLDYHAGKTPKKQLAQRAQEGLKAQLMAGGDAQPGEDATIVNLNDADAQSLTTLRDILGQINSIAADLPSEDQDSTRNLQERKDEIADLQEQIKAGKSDLDAAEQQWQTAAPLLNSLQDISGILQDYQSFQDHMGDQRGAVENINHLHQHNGLLESLQGKGAAGENPEVTTCMCGQSQV